MKIFNVKLINYFIFSIILFHSPINYAEDSPVYFIGLQANQIEQATPFVYICAPVDTTVPPSYICAPTSAPSVTTNQSMQPQKIYPQILGTSSIYNYKSYIQPHSPQYRHFGANTSLSNYYSPQYRPNTTDFSENYESSPIAPQNVSAEPLVDSWSPTSNYSVWQSQNLNQNRLYSPVYPQNPYVNNIKNNVWQTTPRYRPDKNIPSSSLNPFVSQPAYQSEINH